MPSWDLKVCVPQHLIQGYESIDMDFYRLWSDEKSFNQWVKDIHFLYIEKSAKMSQASIIISRFKPDAVEDLFPTHEARLEVVCLPPPAVAHIKSHQFFPVSWEIHVVQQQESHWLSAFRVPSESRRITWCVYEWLRSLTETAPPWCWKLSRISGAAAAHETCCLAFLLCNNRHCLSFTPCGSPAEHLCDLHVSPIPMSQKTSKAALLRICRDWELVAHASFCSSCEDSVQGTVSLVPTVSSFCNLLSMNLVSKKIVQLKACIQSSLALRNAMILTTIFVANAAWLMVKIPPWPWLRPKHAWPPMSSQAIRDFSERIWFWVSKWKFGFQRQDSGFSFFGFPRPWSRRELQQDSLHLQLIGLGAYTKHLSL